ncbi:MAG TPA: non-ribosomal peptide synthetase, partial [Longimicrobiaceae bacterium]|nr:non-ribosomal peptide synthetase [Longimicrobiaceae bacterium]
MQQSLCIHELFERQVLERPHATALVHGDTRLSYAELDARAGRLARALRGLGVGPGVYVGVCAERSVELVVGLLGVLKAGGAYVTLDPAFPAERLAFMLADTGAPVLLTGGDRAALFAGYRGTRVRIEEASAGDEAAAPVDAGVGPDDPAYVTFTSGSTGQAKGTMIPHRSIPGFIFGVGYVSFDPAQTLLHYSSISWDALTLELWASLVTGACCVLFDGPGTDLDGLAETIRKHGVTTLWVTSSLFNALIDTRPDALAGVSQLMVGGEALSVPHVRRAMEALPGVRLVNGYGPSECTVFCACHPLDRPLPPEAASVPIGRPIGDRRVYILDAYLNPAPIGIPGELHVGGPAVSIGYLGRPDTTAEKFVPDPFSRTPGARMYRTGDLALYRRDGLIEFVGRADDQVKIRGHRIEPGEVEAVLLAHPGVRSGAVAVRSDGDGRKMLAAYFVPEGAGGAGTEDLRAYFMERVPEYMVPAAFVLLEALPLTPNGKLDRRALPDPAPAAAASASGYTAPSTPAERILAELWAELLRVERVGVHENFFELGGDSILSIQIVARARERGLR